MINIAMQLSHYGSLWDFLGNFTLKHSEQQDFLKQYSFFANAMLFFDVLVYV